MPALVLVTSVAQAWCELSLWCRIVVVLRHCVCSSCGAPLIGRSRCGAVCGASLIGRSRCGAVFEQRWRCAIVISNG